MAVMTSTHRTANSAQCHRTAASYIVKLFPRLPQHRPLGRRPEGTGPSTPPVGRIPEGREQQRHMVVPRLHAEADRDLVEEGGLGQRGSVAAQVVTREEG